MVSNQGELIQAFELLDGKVNITGGMIDVRTLVHCVEDATLDVYFPKGTATIEMKAGQDYAINDLKVEVKSGKIHYN